MQNIKFIAHQKAYNFNILLVGYLQIENVEKTYTLRNVVYRKVLFLTQVTKKDIPGVP